jgi:5'-nucleotidase
MKVVYDTSRSARNSAATAASVGTGDRVRSIVLDDGTVLVDNGAVVSPRVFSFATIDFTANGGDGYPFAFNNVVFNNTVNTITYQEALADFIEAPKAAGGLQRLSPADGDEITTNAYPLEDAFDLHGRLVDLAVARVVPGVLRQGTSGRDTLVGTAGDDTLTGGPGADMLTGGAGGDLFRFTSLRDAGDTITDFTPHVDKLDLSQLLGSLGVIGNGGATGHVRFVDVIGGTLLQIDPDGSAGPAVARPYITLKGLTARQMSVGRDLLSIPAASSLAQ